jgi:hypothetical protein
MAPQSTFVDNNLFTANSLLKTVEPLPPGTTPVGTVTAGGNTKTNSKTNQPKPVPTAHIAEFNSLYNDLIKSTDDGRELIGDDPFLQKKAIDNINEFLKRFPDTKANPNYKQDDTIPWTDLSVSVLFKKTIRTLIDIINDLADIISASESNSAATTRRNIMNAFFQKERRLYVGFLFIFISFVLYFVDSA